MIAKVLLGTGVLQWDAEERRSDRYGTVYLFTDTSLDVPIVLKRVPEGMLGYLVAVVKETRQPEHIGDILRNIYPRRPDIGDEITLGYGRIFYQHFEYTHCSVYAVGLKPRDLRLTDWLEPAKLYSTHSQTVELYFEEHEQDRGH